MRPRYFFSALEFLVVLFLFLGGMSLFGLSHSMSVRENIALWLLDYSEGGSTGLIFIGLGCILIAFFLGAGFFLIEKKRCVSFVMESKGAEIKEEALKQGIGQFFRQESFSCIEFFDLVIWNNKIEIILSLKEKQKKGLRKKELYNIEKKLGIYLNKYFDYNKPFFVSLYE